MAAPSFETPACQLAFRCHGLPADTFAVSHLRGTETLSKIPEYTVVLTSRRDDIPTDSLLDQPALVVVEVGGVSRRIAGIVASCEFVQRNPHFSVYHVTLKPRLQRLATVKQSRVFNEMSLTDILNLILGEYGLEPGEDFRLQLQRDYPVREYVVQYQETDLDFLARLMEHEGIYYFFEPDMDRDFMVCMDTSSQHEPVPGGVRLAFRDGRPFSPDGPAISQLVVRQSRAPGEVTLKDYNYRKPTVDLNGRAEAPESEGTTIGRLMEYGDHFKTPEEGDRLARIRLEELSCLRRVSVGASGYLSLSPGRTFDLDDHFRAECNGAYLIVHVEHDCRQSSAPGDATELTTGPGYLNNFQAIPRETQFRAPRTTTRPRIYGTMHATIDGAGSGQFAEIDSQGRYKVRLPFDLSGVAGGKASRFVRMAQPYAGVEYGAHFPLHKGTEVLLTHIDGDPDRPIILAAVPNPATGSPVTQGNHTQSMIKTAASNQVILEDATGGERILISTPLASTSLNLGAAADGGVAGITLRTGGDELEQIAGMSARQVGKDSLTEVGNSATESIGQALTIKAGTNIVLEAGVAITLQCGAASLHMNQAGFITLKGTVLNIAGAVACNMAAPMTNVVGGILMTTTGAINLSTGALNRVTGSNLASVSGGKAEVVANGDTVVQGAKVLINC